MGVAAPSTASLRCLSEASGCRRGRIAAAPRPPAAERPRAPVATAGPCRWPPARARCLPAPNERAKPLRFTNACLTVDAGKLAEFRRASAAGHGEQTIKTQRSQGRRRIPGPRMQGGDAARRRRLGRPGPPSGSVRPLPSALCHS